MAKAIRNGQGEFATKADSAELRADVRADLAALETRLRNRLYAVALGIDIIPGVLIRRP